MSIPKIMVPEYTVTIPSTLKPVKFRPFLVKENKILMLAEESKNIDQIYNAIIQVISNCTYDKLQVSSLSTLDLQYLFFKIRAKSMGEIAQFNVPCKNCQAKNLVDLNFDNIEIKTIPGHNKKVILDNESGIVFKYPSLEAEKILLDNTLNDGEKEVKLIAMCIDYFYNKTDVVYAKDCEEKEVNDFIENLSLENFNKIKHFFETIPKISYEIKYKCTKCSTEDQIIIENIRDFFT